MSGRTRRELASRALLAFVLCSAACGRIDFDLVALEDAEVDRPPFVPVEHDAALPTEMPDADQPDADDVQDADLPDATPACGGLQIIAACWYLADYKQSCRAACEAHEGVDLPALASVGTSSEGGLQRNCRAVLTAFGEAAPVYSFRNDGLAFGCHVWRSGASYWSDDPTPPTDPDFGGYSVTRMACPCLR